MNARGKSLSPPILTAKCFIPTNDMFSFTAVIPDRTNNSSKKSIGQSSRLGTTQCLPLVFTSLRLDVKILQGILLGTMYKGLSRQGLKLI